MRKQLIVLVMLIAISLVLGCTEKQPTAPAPTPAATPAENLVPLHLNAAGVSSEKCKGCHDVSKEASLKPDVKTAHVVHLSSTQLKFECNTCHKSVDLEEVSSAALRQQVDPVFCTKCHSSLKEAHPVIGTLECTSCHSNWKEKMAGATYINLDAVTSNDCRGCHGGRVWYIGGK